MLKSLFATAILFTSLSSFAVQTEVPTEKVPTYIKAVQIALAEKPLTCQFTTGSFLWTSAQMSSSMTGMKSAKLDSAGGQPVLVFEKWIDGADFVSFSVTTSSDYKSVNEVYFQQDKCIHGIRGVNLGTITEPEIVERPFSDCTVTFAATCK